MKDKSKYYFEEKPREIRDSLIAISNHPNIEAFKSLVKRFGLECEDLNNFEYYDSPEIIKIIETEQLKNKSTNKKTNKMSKEKSTPATEKSVNSIPVNIKDKFKKEAEDSPMAQFCSFSNVGEFKTGFIIGTVPITNAEKKTRNCYQLKIDTGEVFILPSNFQLQTKLDNMVKVKGGIPAKGIEVYIELTGSQKIEGSVNEMKTFEVRYN